MNRAIAVILALLVPMAAIVAVAMLTSAHGLPTQAQVELNEYLQYQRLVLGQTISIQQTVQATRPWNFTPQMSDATFGDSPFYRTSHTYYATPVVNSPYPSVATPWMSDFSNTASGLRPVPFPPEDMWCILLHQEHPTTSKVVFVALHQDLYNADWLVHEPAGELHTRELTATLSSIGCDLQ
jgi:hypothetical protein